MPINPLVRKMYNQIAFPIIFWLKRLRHCYNVNIIIKRSYIGLVILLILNTSESTKLNLD